MTNMTNAGPSGAGLPICGPWEVRPCYLQMTGNITSLDICHPAEPGARGVCVVASVFEGEAVARLIAAAPELYAALEMCRWELNELAKETPGQTEARLAASAALTRAQGDA